jgi:hypothetical protein
MRTKNMTTLQSTKSIDPSPLRPGLRFGGLALVLACFVLSPAARAVTPAPDGNYQFANTAEGGDALSKVDITRGWYNTAIGYAALHEDVIGTNNTAVRANSLYSNTAGFNTAVGGLCTY